MRLGKLVSHGVKILGQGERFLLVGVSIIWINFPFGVLPYVAALSRLNKELG